MRIWFAAGLSALALAACGPRAPAAPTAEEIAAASSELNTWLDAEFEEELQMSPETLTFLGRKEKYDTLTPRTDEEQDRYLAWRRESVAEMKAKFDPAKLDEEARTSYDMWAQALETAEATAKFRRQPYIFIKDGDHAFLPNFLMNFHRVDEKADMEAWIARVGAVATAIDQDIVRAKAAAEAGVRPPRFAYDQALTESRNVITGQPFSAGADSPLYGDAKAKLAALKEAGKITDEESAALLAAATAALKDQLKPAYDRLTAWLTEDRERAAAESQGVASLPDGEAYYNAMLKVQTTTDMTAEEIHQLGLSEVARIRAEMEAIKTQVGFDGTLEEFFAFMRSAPQFHLPSTDEGASAYIKLAEDYLAGMTAKLPEYFGILPKAGLVVKRVEAFREEAGGAQHYFPGTPDGSRPGVFYAHLSDMHAMPTYELEAIAYHEGVPGHHMQISIAQELTGVPMFRTQYGYTAYSEGWGLYSEKLAKDMGFYTDPYSDFGRLGAEVWRAIRLVVDTGMHAKGWSEEEAVQYFIANSPAPEAAIRSEIRRYLVWPGQATAYKVGMLKILELRTLAQQELGDRFTYGAFHDTVLGGGALPLPVLEARVKRWIEKTKAS